MVLIFLTGWLSIPKVADGKSRLGSLIFAQGFIQFLAAVVLYLSAVEGGTLDRLSVASSAVYFISLLMGELGRKRSRTGLLKVYLLGSSVGVLVSIVCLLKSGKSLEIIKDLSKWEATNLELFKIAAVLLGSLLQILAVSTTTSLIGNMAPPKRAS
ncbi:uncharacterized protein LOC127244736 isoform X2 [Andrographis paniculata]|uniref:uncharacterized protein LOC127244736 isoform X2 n=1 Tax=Andrographis paniculata TaxID=175694 RepID=UPI0021E8BE19|nr:uncharacterized protein LOC127244736 isoform X2 [Andrographis paniculata]